MTNITGREGREAPPDDACGRAGDELAGAPRTNLPYHLVTVITSNKYNKVILWWHL
jgi:hypothetical protein